MLALFPTGGKSLGFRCESPMTDGSNTPERPKCSFFVTVLPDVASF